MPSATLSYWTVQGRHEVDFVIERGRDSVAVEVKAATRWGTRDLAGLRAFLDVTPRCRAALLVTQEGDRAQLGERLWALPLHELLS